MAATSGQGPALYWKRQRASLKSWDLASALNPLMGAKDSQGVHGGSRDPSTIGWCVERLHAARLLAVTPDRIENRTYLVATARRHRGRVRAKDTESSMP